MTACPHDHTHGLTARTGGPDVSRRVFLGGAIGCGAHVLMALAGGGLTRRALAAAQPGEFVLEAPFARIEKVADGVWSIISTPLAGNMTTLCNGGIVAGSEGVAVIEAFNTVQGAAWACDAAHELTGRHPTHVILSHYHADHSAGLAGYQRGAEGPAIVSTAKTRELLLERQAPQGEPSRADAGKPFVRAPRLMLPDSIVADTENPTELDLGGRTLRIAPRKGHTPSDVTVELVEPRVLWCGDLVFNGLFPFYGDAIPSALGENCNAMLRDAGTLYVPGHGLATDAAGLEPYLNLLADVEAAARRAHEAGTPADEAWKTYQMPEALSAWIKFRPDIFRFAFEAWERELKGGA
jgi:glyoxylase-like metal-dependent hydrolase (beta-lactamase superfamily II)